MVQDQLTGSSGSTGSMMMLYPSVFTFTVGGY